MKTIELSGDVGFEITAEGLKEQLGKSREAVRLKIDSYGGSVFEAVRLYNTIKDYPGKITAELGAVAASAASFFPLAASRIEVRSNTTYMGHKAWSFAIGNSDDMTAEALILEGLDSIIAGVYSKKNRQG
jgi:ATP-dependent protease ClpP protease subunit